MIKIKDEFIKEAKEYALISREYTSDDHDFHEGGLDAKQRKMFEGKLGEKSIKQFFLDNNIEFTEDKSDYRKADEYDFLVYKNKKKYLVDVKTRTKSFHTRTLEMVKQLNSKKIDIYISVHLKRIDSSYHGKILGWCGRNDVFNINRIENNGYLDNYVVFDNELRNIENLKDYL